MIDKAYFSELRGNSEKFDNKREEVIKLARNILKSSKKSIFASHRGDLEDARSLLDDIKKQINQMEVLVGETHDLMMSIHDDAFEEYVEAECFYSFLKNKKIPKHDELGVNADLYLQGLCDLTGELTRKAVNDVINGNEKSVLEIKNFISELYEELMQFDFRNGPLRRKYDAVKYALEKLESLALKVKLK